MPDTQVTILGFDFGMRRIGLAVGQTVSRTATPLTIINAIDGIPNWTTIDAYVQEWQPGALVVGLPYKMDGSEQEMTKAARKFGHRLQAKFALPVHFVDERLTSVAAKQMLREKGASQTGPIDAIAAVLILESWFNGAHQ